MICSKCGRELSANASFCVNCGTKTGGKQICKVCGEPLAANARFCLKCGHECNEKKTNRKCSCCLTELSDNMVFCPSCGMKIEGDARTVRGPYSGETYADDFECRQNKKRMIIGVTVGLLICAIVIGIGIWMNSSAYLIQKLTGSTWYTETVYDDGYSYYNELKFYSNGVAIITHHRRGDNWTSEFDWEVLDDKSFRHDGEYYYDETYYDWGEWRLSGDTLYLNDVEYKNHRWSEENDQ